MQVEGLRTSPISRSAILAPAECVASANHHRLREPPFWRRSDPGGACDARGWLASAKRPRDDAIGAARKSSRSILPPRCGTQESIGGLASNGARVAARKVADGGQTNCHVSLGLACIFLLHRSRGADGSYCWRALLQGLTSTSELPNSQLRPGVWKSGETGLGRPRLGSVLQEARRSNRTALPRKAANPSPRYRLPGESPPLESDYGWDGAGPA